MSIFDEFLKDLAQRGYRYDTGFLIKDASVSESPSVIGFRFESGVQQIDLYVRDDFWDASKSHPIFGESQEIRSSAGNYKATQILVGK